MYKIIGADGREYGPISLEVLRQWISEGRANSETKILPEGTTEWKKLGDLPEFSADPSQLSAPTPVPGPAAATPSPPGPISALPTPARNNPLAITGLVLGIISITIGLCCYGLPFNIAGAICSAIALAQIKKDPQHERGEGIAIAGLVLSLLSLIFAVLLVAFYFSMGSSNLLHRLRRL
jgi:hypothetical protein